jgi:hypothetical protein
VPPQCQYLLACVQTDSAGTGLPKSVRSEW